MGSSAILPAPGQPAEGPDKNFVQSAVPNIVSFDFEKVAPPSQVYIQRDDVLVIQFVSLLAGPGQFVTVTARLLLPYAQAPGQPDQAPPSGVAGGPIIGPGYIQTISQTFQTPTARVQFTGQVALTEGYLLSVSINTQAAPVRGLTFARAFINRGPFNANLPSPVAALVADYVTQAAPIGWPNGRWVSPSDNVGVINNETLANPAAGTDFSLLIPILTGRSRLQYFTATFTASAAVGNRVPGFIINCRGTSAPSVPFTMQDSVAVTAGQQVIYSVGSGGSFWRGAGSPAAVVMSLPSPFIGTLASGAVEYNINSSTQGILAGDTWTNIALIDEEMFDAF